MRAAPGRPWNGIGPKVGYERPAWGGDLSYLWVIVPPWVYSVVVTFLGRWGERHLFAASPPRADTGPAPSGWAWLLILLAANLIFLSVIPAFVLVLFQPMLPFIGARAGLALAVVTFLFGLVPVRLFDAPRHGWDRTFWTLLVDFLRLAGALTLVGWLLTF